MTSSLTAARRKLARLATAACLLRRASNRGLALILALTLGLQPTDAAVRLWFQSSAAAPATQVLVAASPAWTTTSSTYRYLNDLDPDTGAAMSTLSPPKYGVRGFATPRLEYGWLGQIGDNATVANAVANGTTSTTAMPSAVAAPILQWISPAATDTMLSGTIRLQVQAFAAATDGIYGGVPSVDFWVNDSAPVNVSQVTAEPVKVYGGTRKTPVFGVDAQCTEGAVLDYYARANVTPDMAAQGMQPRVIGPMRVYCKANYDAQANLFAPGTANPAATNLNPPSFSDGANYDNLPKALNALANWSGWNTTTGSQVRIKAVEDQSQDIGGTASNGVGTLAFSNNITKTNGRRGRVTIDGNGYNTTLYSARWQNTATNNIMRFQYNGLTLTNLKVDNTRMGVWMGYQNEKIVNLLDNVDIAGPGIAEANGADGTQMQPRTTYFWTTNSLIQLTRSTIHDMAAGDIQIPMRIGTKIANQAGDAVAIGSAAISNFRIPLSVIDDTMDNVSSMINNFPTLVMTLTYSGANPSLATYAIRGVAAHPNSSSDATSPRTLVLRYNGQDVSGGSFAGSYPGQAGGINSIGDLVNAINTWSAANGGLWTAATVGDPSAYNRLRASFICTQRYVNYNTPPADQIWYASTGIPEDVTKPDVPLGVGVWTGNSQHPDLLQFLGQDNVDNVLYSGVYATNFNTQGLTIQLQNALPNYKASNIALVQVAYNSTTNSPDYRTFNSYFGGTLNHALIVNNTSPSGNFFFFNATTSGFLYDKFSRTDSNYNTAAFYSTASGTPFSNYASTTILGQARRTRALHVNPTNNSSSFDFATAYPDEASDNKVMDPSNTLTIATTDYPAVAHGQAEDGNLATLTISDFIPVQGGLLRQPGNLVKKQIDFDMEGRARQPYDLAGPIALSASP